MASIYGIIAQASDSFLLENVSKMMAGCPFGSGQEGLIRVKSGAAFGVRSWRPALKRTVSISSGEGSIMCAFAGELYNLSSLVSSYRSRGYRLKANKPSSLIRVLYQEEGPDFPRKCNGIFIAAVWDEDARCFLLARDHMGSRSAYYAFKGEKVLFASSVTSLLSIGLVEASLNIEAVNYYLASTVVPHPHTLIEGIWSIPPGHTLLFQNGELRVHRYWHLERIIEDRKTSKSEFKERIREVVRDSVKLRCAGDAKVGCVLSGGVDSSTICSLMTTFGQEPIESFSIAYDEAAYDDSDLQRIMHARFNLAANVSQIRAEDVPNLLGRVVQVCDVPVNNASAMGTIQCFEMAAEKVDVVLEGEAADELFCGGGGVVGERLVELFDFIPLALRRLLFGFLGQEMFVDHPGRWMKIRRFFHRLTLPQDVRILTWLPAFDKAARRRLFSEGYLDMVERSEPFGEALRSIRNIDLADSINRYQYTACKTYLCDDLLYKNERMAAANGIINRTPFIDYRLAELAFSIPAKYKLTGVLESRVQKKLIYRQALQGLIPDEILWRRKMRGFSQPVGMWMGGPLKSYVKDVLLDRRTLERGIFNRRYIEKLLYLHFRGLHDCDRLIWGLLTLELWLRCHYDG